MRKGSPLLQGLLWSLLVRGGQLLIGELALTTPPLPPADSWLIERWEARKQRGPYLGRSEHPGPVALHQRPLCGGEGGERASWGIGRGEGEEGVVEEALVDAVAEGGDGWELGACRRGRLPQYVP